MNVTNNITYSATYTITAEWAAVASVTILLLLLYLFILVVILRDPSDFNSSYYTLVVALALSDFCSLLFVIYRALLGKTYYGLPIDNTLVIIYQACGWYYGLYLNISVALNRFFAVTFFTKYKTIFTIVRARILSVVCFIIAVLHHGSKYVFPNAVPYVADLAFGNTVISLVLVSYLAAAIYCMVNLNHISGSSKIPYIREIKMLVQGTLISTLLFIVQIMYWFPITDLILKIVLMLATGLNPVIYLVMDDNLRQKVFKITKLKSVMSVVGSKRSSNAVSAIPFLK